MGYIIRPLGKLHKIGDIVTTIILWLKKETQTELDPDFVKVLVNLAVSDVAEILSGAGSSDYSKDVTISDQSSSVTNTIKTPAAFDTTTKSILFPPHGLTANDVGKRIVVWGSNEDPWEAGKETAIAIAEVVSIVDDNNFVISQNVGVNTISYAVFAPYSQPSVDLAGYNIAGITKVFDSINKEVVKAGDVEFDNIYRFPTKQNKVFYNVRGQYLFLTKGSEVANFGTITMTYNSYPQKTTENDDYLDIKDMYISLVILKAKNFCVEHLGLTAPESLTSTIDAKTKEVRANILAEKELANQKNHK